MEHLSEIILNLGQHFRMRCSPKIFLFFLSSGGQLVQWSRTVWAILVEDLMRNLWV